MTTKGRYVDVVIKEIIQIIPASENKLIVELNKYLESLRYKDPELKTGSDCWIPFMNILNFHIPKIEDEWQIKLRNIINVTD